MNRRITHLIGQLIRGGSERQLLCLVAALKERGWQQAVVTLNPGDVWEDRLTQIGVPLLFIPRSFFKLQRIRQLRSILRCTLPEVLHSWSNHANIYAHWASLGLDIRRIVSIRGNPRLGFADRELGSVLRVFNRRSYQAAHCVISNSQAGLDELLGDGIRPLNTYIVGNFVQAKGRACVATTSPVTRIVAAGILVPNKAYDVLLQALARVVKDHQSFELLLAGEGPDRARLEGLASQLGLSEKVKFLGSIEDVPDLLASAHMVVHTSRSEGLSNTLLEAMAEGLPVIATAVGGTPELIKDGETGLLVPPDEPDLLADKIKRLLGDSHLRSSLGLSALRMVQSTYSSETVVGQYERVYQSLLSNRGSSNILVPKSVAISTRDASE